SVYQAGTAGRRRVPRPRPPSRGDGRIEAVAPDLDPGSRSDCAVQRRQARGVSEDGPRAAGRGHRRGGVPRRQEGRPAIPVRRATRLPAGADRGAEGIRDGYLEGKGPRPPRRDRVAGRRGRGLDQAISSGPGEYPRGDGHSKREVNVAGGAFGIIRMDRSNHYEAAFEGYLRDQGVCYVAVDERRRALLDHVPLKSLD